MRSRIVRGRLIALSAASRDHRPGCARSRLHCTTASGGIGIRLVDLPVDSPRHRLPTPTSSTGSHPGRDIHRQIEIINGTRSSANVAVYPAAASLRYGKFGFAPNRSKNELSSWTSVSRTVLHMPRVPKHSKR